MADKTKKAWLSDSSPARELRMTAKHAPVYIVVVAITYAADVIMGRIGYRPPNQLAFLLAITPGLLILFMPLTPFLFYLIGTYYDLREYADERRFRRRHAQSEVGDDRQAGSQHAQ